jgi:fibronectin type 3 domain-containing protein
MKLLACLLLLFAVSLSAQPHPSVTLNWSWAQGTGDPATGFHIQRGTAAGGPYVVVGTVPVASGTFLDTTVTVGSTYFYVVTAFNTGGDSVKSNETSCTLPFLPASAPTGLSATTK